MIVWLASYPKSGNTWLRALISAYYYSKDGIYTDNIIKKIGQFPEKRHFTEFEYDQNIVTDTTRFWLQAQKNIFLVSSALYASGVNSVPLCDPSQKGCFELFPHEHQ